jgi:hypothetical protein
LFSTSRICDTAKFVFDPFTSHPHLFGATAEAATAAVATIERLRGVLADEQPATQQR